MSAPGSLFVNCFWPSWSSILILLSVMMTSWIPPAFTSSTNLLSEICSISLSLLFVNTKKAVIASAITIKYVKLFLDLFGMVSL